MRPARSKLLAIAAALACACALAAVAVVFQPAVPGKGAEAVGVAATAGLVGAASATGDPDPGSDPHVFEDPSASAPSASAPDDASTAYAPDAVLAKLAVGMTDDQAREALAEIPGLEGASIAKRVDGDLVKVSLPEGVSVERALELLGSAPSFESAQPNYRYYIQEGVVEASAAQAPSAAAAATASLKQAAADATAGLVAGTALGNALSIQSSAPNDPYYSRQWSLPSVNALQAWDLVNADTTETPSVTVAVIDNGFHVDHDDLKDHVVDAYNVATDSTAMGTDNSDHGTHVAGIVGAVTNNSKGVAAIGGNALGLMLLRVSDSKGEITTDTIVSAYSYIMKNAAAHNVRVVNMSLGAATPNAVSRSTDPELYDAISEARSAGIVTVVAACNEENGYRPPFNAFPGDFDNVVSVINLAEDDGSDGVKRDVSSNYNTLLQPQTAKAKNVSAPGTNIYSTYSYRNRYSYGLESGTSMSSPLVAGVFGLMFAVNPDLTAEHAESLLYGSAKDLTESPASQGWDAYTGYGEVDAAAAVQAARVIDVSTCAISVSDGVYTGNPVEVSVEVVNESETLQPGIDYVVSFNNNVNVGTGVFSVTGRGRYGGVVAGTFTINPKGTSIKKLKSLKRGITVKWKKRSAQTSGYQVRVATNKAFTKNVKTVKAAKASITSKAVKSLKAKKRYYAKVRTYKIVNGTKYYSSWSKAKTVKTKR